MDLTGDIFAFVYLIATVLFILGLKGLSSPSTALNGNRFAMTGMAIAVIAALSDPSLLQFQWIFAALVIGGVIGVIVAIRIEMTDMPQLVAILHSFVGLSAVLVAIGTYLNSMNSESLSSVTLIELSVGSLIGAITFTGSLVAFAKLQGLAGSNPFVFKGQHFVNLILGITMFGLIGYFVITADPNILLILTGIALVLGVLLIIPIGGADMPVVVSMLNSYSGWAAAATGFTLENNLLVTTGALVGSSGAILSYIMCRAMNRSFISVILGGFGGDDAGAGHSDGVERSVRSAAPEDLAYMLGNSAKVIVVPGYGMAVAQAQHSIKELFEILTAKGVEVKFAIHPVAGRMPGHMNVLLAEADIPYDAVFEMDEVNSDFNGADIALVIGANDVVNPDAKTDKTSPLYGMPILDAYRAQQVYVVKRSLKSGYAGVDNSLFYLPNCSLVFGDAKAVSEKLVQAIREL